MAADKRWENETSKTHGRRAVERQTAIAASLPWKQSFLDLAFPDAEERLATRLGARDLVVTFEGAGPTGPFGRRVKTIAIPAYWLTGVGPTDNSLAEKIVETSAGFSFQVGAVRFDYSRLGLSLEGRT